MNVEEAIAALKAYPRDDGSPLPWHAVKAHVLDVACDDTADCESPLDAAHIAAAVNAAPVLIAEVERLQAALAAARVAVEELPDYYHESSCGIECGHKDCDCPAEYGNEKRCAVRRALGLEPMPAPPEPQAVSSQGGEVENG